MDRYLGLLSICLCCLSVLGCGIVAKQEWSENYTSIEGVRATNAKMIDGNIRTFGEQRFVKDHRIPLVPLRPHRQSLCSPKER